MWLFCCALAGRLLVLFAFHFLSLYKPKSFHLVSTVADRTRAWRLPEGVGAGGPAGGRAPLGAEPPLPGRGEGRVQERSQLSRCWVSILLRPFSHLGRTKTLPCELWSSTQHQLGGHRQPPPTPTRCHRYPKRWRTPRLGADLVSPRGSAPP